MSRLMIGALAVGLLTLGPSCGIEALAQKVHEDFETTVQLDLDGEFSIENVNGSIRVETWAQDEVRIQARKSASSQEALERIEIDVQGGGDRVDVKTRYPKLTGFLDSHRSVSYEIWVPEMAQVRAETVNGQVEIGKVGGSVRVKSVNGGVHVRGIEGEADVSTVNGGIEVRYSAAPDAGNHSFSTVNGGVDLFLPSSVSGEFKARTVNGGIDTDFPLEVRGGKYGTPRRMDGRLGDAQVTFKITTVNGSIDIREADRSI